MSEWYERGTDRRDEGVCFYCGNDASHFDDFLQIDLCDDQQCLDEAYMSADKGTTDLVDRFNK